MQDGCVFSFYRYGHSDLNWLHGCNGIHQFHDRNQLEPWLIALDSLPPCINCTVIWFYNNIDRSQGKKKHSWCFLHVPIIFHAINWGTRFLPMKLWEANIIWDCRGPSLSVAVTKFRGNSNLWKSVPIPTLRTWLALSWGQIWWGWALNSTGSRAELRKPTSWCQCCWADAGSSCSCTSQTWLAHKLCVGPRIQRSCADLRRPHSFFWDAFFCYQTSSLWGTFGPNSLPSMLQHLKLQSLPMMQYSFLHVSFNHSQSLCFDMRSRRLNCAEFLLCQKSTGTQDPYHSAYVTICYITGYYKADAM